jgi:hypothetical protein
MDRERAERTTCRVQCNQNLTTKFEFYKGQNYEQLKKECLENGTLFEDPLFRTIDSSISYTSAPPLGTKWKRPFEIVKSPIAPLFIQDEANCDDLDQGQLGNCWFIAGCTAIVTIPTLFERIVPKNQPITGTDYAGIFHFRFWIFGTWYDVTIDDRLPVSPSNQLLFCQNKQQPNEFWAALLEKAYAKICLSYENLDGGFTTDAVSRFSKYFTTCKVFLCEISKAHRHDRWNPRVIPAEENANTERKESNVADRYSIPTTRVTYWRQYRPKSKNQRSQIVQWLGDGSR